MATSYVPPGRSQRQILLGGSGVLLGSGELVAAGVGLWPKALAPSARKIMNAHGFMVRPSRVLGSCRRLKHPFFRSVLRIPGASQPRKFRTARERLGMRRRFGAFTLRPRISKKKLRCAWFPSVCRIEAELQLKKTKIVRRPRQNWRITRRCWLVTVTRLSDFKLIFVAVGKMIY